MNRLFPDGTVTLSTEVGPEGRNISAGELIRISLARALLRHPWLLLLDEPTAFLDPDSADRVVEVLRPLSSSVTMVIATHEPQRFEWAYQVVSLTPASPLSWPDPALDWVDSGRQALLGVQT